MAAMAAIFNAVPLQFEQNPGLPHNMMYSAQSSEWLLRRSATIFKIAAMVAIFDVKTRLLSVDRQTD